MTRSHLLATALVGAGLNLVPSHLAARGEVAVNRSVVLHRTGPAAVDTIAFVNVNVVPLDREGVLRDQSVLVHDGRIVDMGPAAATPISERVTRIEGKGRYLIPGLFDMHSHLLSDDRIADDHAGAELAVILANGVTSIRIPIGKPEHLEYRRRIEGGEMIGPALYVGSPQIAGQAFGSVFNGREVKTADQARQAVRDFHAEGYDFIKLTFFISEEVYDAVIAAASELGIPVVGHVGPQVRLARALQAGQQIEHLDQYLEAMLPEDAPTRNSLSGIGIWQRPNWESLDYIDESKIADLARATAEAGVWNTPTLAFLNSSFGTGRSADELAESPDYAFVSAEVREELLRGRDVFWANPPPEERRLRYVDLRNRLTKALYEAGARLMAGSDAPEWLLLGGFTLHRELESLVEAGLPPHAALEAATRNPAEWLGVLEETGTIEVGKRADLVLLRANPLESISNTRRIEGVMVGGQWLSRIALDFLLDRGAAELSQAGLRDAPEADTE
ncbi:MAG: amidohydrolase family protein [Gemmatimonadales bacterium]